MLQSELLYWLSGQLIALGPGVLFLVCLLETAVFAGLILPVGALIAFSAMLAARGLLDPGQVIAMALLGALVGDQVGFAIGRWFVTAAQPRPGRITRVWRTALAGTESLIRRHGLLGVSAARAIPFVRTIMPWFAGRAGITWGRFLAFDILGILLWGTVYLGGGFIAGESWRQVAGRFGEVAGGVVLVLALIVIVSISERFRRRWLRRRRR